MSNILILTSDQLESQPILKQRLFSRSSANYQQVKTEIQPMINDVKKMANQQF